MARRFIVTFLCALLIALPLFGRGRGGRSRSSSRGYSSRSYRAHSSRSYSSRSYSSRSSTRKPVHVGTYTRRNGTVVHSHTRSLPGTTPRRSSTPRTHYAAPRTRSVAPSRIGPVGATSTHRRSTSLSSHDSRGREKRSEAAKDAFKHLHPCPSTGRSSGPCPGYVIDHRIALACGGADSPFNMQWQTTADAKAKDEWERKGCR